MTHCQFTKEAILARLQHGTRMEDVERDDVTLTALSSLKTLKAVL